MSERSSNIGWLSLLLLLVAPAVQSQMRFEDVSEASGLRGFTESWGAAWGDMNGDNWPDLFIQGHRDFPRAYRNTGEGTFEDVAYAMDTGKWIAKPFDDKHGASWADFDNDGDEDLLLGVSATGAGQLLVNEGGVFVDRAQQMGLASDSTNRQPVWVDFTGDGFLDVMQLHLDGAFLRRQDPSRSRFVSATGSGFSCTGDHNYGQMLDVNNDGSLEFICAEEGNFPSKMYDISRYPFLDLTSTIPSTALVNDSVVADFNGDLRYDIIMTRGQLRPSGATLVSGNRIESWLRRGRDTTADKGFTFTSPGEITVTEDHYGMGIYQDSIVKVLSPQGPTSGFVGDVFVSYSASSGTWRVSLSDNNNLRIAYVSIATAAPASNLEMFGLDAPELPTQLRYLENSSGGMNIKNGAGLHELMSCVSAAAGDFDNDMDVDLYLVCRDGAENIANRLYENQGDGTFVLVPNSGAEGPQGAGFEFGVGDSVVVADYDVDGFLDLFVTNGLLLVPIGKGGPDVLLRNQGNSNHWIQIDLRGTFSNRDGNGAKVYLTAGGITQLREQNGGYHRWSQNHQRLHFGLAGHQTADIRIEWPSGTVDTFNGVAADRLYDATENGSLTEAVLGPPVHTALQAGDECGQPPYNLNYGPAVLLWRDCPGNTWHLRARGGREKQQQLYTEGNIAADAAFSSVSAHNLGGNDVLNNSPPEEIHFSVGAWFSNDKGFNFSTSGQSRSCFDLTTQDIPALIVGSSRKWMKAPFDLVTLGECTTTPPPPVDPECGNPLYNKATEPGLFAWRDCAYGGPEARWIFRVSAGGQPWSEYAGTVTGDTTLAAGGFNLEASDTLDSVPGDAEIDFSLFVGGNGHDGFQIDVPAGAQACFATTRLPAGAQVMIGADRQVMAGAFDLVTLEACTVEPPPVDPACGEPAYDRATEVGVFVWRNCAAAGPAQQWHLRVTGGGTTWSPFVGEVTSDMPLSATGFSVEPNDTFDTTPGDETVDFALYVGGNGVDGFDLGIPENAQACLNMTELKPGAQIELGAAREQKGSQLDLVTLGACN